MPLEQAGGHLGRQSEARACNPKTKWKLLMRVLAIDPGTLQSGLTLYKVPRLPIRFRVLPNAVIAKKMQEGDFFDHLVCEQFKNYGMPVGDESIETIFWYGIFTDIALSQGKKVTLIPRKTIANCVCRSVNAGNTEIEVALRDEFGGKGKKDNPTLAQGIYDLPAGVRKHAWASLAVARTFEELYPTGVLGFTTMLPGYAWEDQETRDEIAQAKFVKQQKKREKRRQAKTA